MKLFLDTADPVAIAYWVKMGIVDGVTTNPTHLSQQGKETKKVLLDICSMVEGDVSIEVVEKSPDDVYRQALEISRLAPNVVVKIPFAKEYLSVIKRLADEGIKLNITLIFSALQALLVAKLNVTYISPFLGRLDDIGVNGMDLLHEIIALKETYGFDSQVLAASIRSLAHWKESVLAGADVVTLPVKVLEQAMVHPLTEQGIEKFDADWKKLGKKALLD